MGTAGFICLYVAARLACMTAGRWLSGRARAGRLRPAAREADPVPADCGAAFTAAVVAGVIRGGRVRGQLAVQAAEISVDDAADIADNLGGGPWVLVSPREFDLAELAAPVRAWDVWVMAFIVEEARGVLDELEAMIAAGRWAPGGVPEMYRLRCGELVRVEREGLPG